jgi:hypothetical protein
MRFLRLSFQFFSAIFKSQPSGINPSKKGNNTELLKASSLMGSVRLIGTGFSDLRYSSAY